MLQNLYYYPESLFLLFRIRNEKQQHPDAIFYIVRNWSGEKYIAYFINFYMFIGKKKTRCFYIDIFLQHTRVVLKQWNLKESRLAEVRFMEKLNLLE